MPELPEVEVTRRSFAAAITKSQIERVQLGKPLRWPLGITPEKMLEYTIGEVTRRGKYILLHLHQGEQPAALLLLHLGMSGSLSFAKHLPPMGMHDHFEMQTTAGVLRLNDPRRFGAVVYAAGGLDDPVSHRLLGGLGQEPLTEDFSAQGFYAALRGKKASIKQVLLSGRPVVGVGNIYASEALHSAGIHPLTPAEKASRQRIYRLHGAIQSILQFAIDAGGTTLRNFSDAQGSSGHFQNETMVYGRAGLPCKTCSCNHIAQITQNARSTFFCLNCQKKPRLSPAR